MCTCSDSLINFPRRTSCSSGLQHQQHQQNQQAQHPEERQSIAQNSNNNGQASIQTTSTQFGAVSNSIPSANNSVNAPSLSTTSTVTVAGLLHQNSMNSRQENHMGTANSPYSGANTMQIPSASSSNSVATSQPNPSSSNNLTPTSHSNLHLNSSQPQEADPNSSQSSVQKILQEMMMSSQLNGMGTLGNELKGINGITQSLNRTNSFANSGIITNNMGLSGMGFGGMVNNAMSMMNGRVGMNQISQDPRVLSHQQLSGLGAVNNFNNLQFDWKTSP